MDRTETFSTPNCTLVDCLDPQPLPTGYVKGLQRKTSRRDSCLVEVLDRRVRDELQLEHANRQRGLELRNGLRWRCHGLLQVRQKL